MIDVRLRRQNHYLVDMDRRIDVAKQATQQPWYSAARAAVAIYLIGLLDFLAKGGHRADADRIKAYCNSASGQAFSGPITPWPKELEANVQLALCEQYSRELGEVQWIIGQALLDALVQRGRATEDSWNVAHLVGMVDVRMSGFNAAVFELSGAAFDFVVEAIRTLVDWERANAARHVLPGRRDEHLLAAREAWAVETDFGAIWDTRAWIGLDMYSEELGILGELCVQRPAVFLPIVEELEVVPLVESVLRSPSIQMDMERVLNLLDEAPSLLDPSSGLWNHKITAGYLLELAFEYVFTLGRPERSNDDRPLADEVELNEFVVAIVGHALRREDGVPLLIRWMRHQVWRLGTNPDDALFQTVFEAATDVLATSPLSVDQIYAPDPDAPTTSALITPQLSATESETRLQALMFAILLEERRIAADRHGTTPQPLRTAFLSLLRQGREAFRPTYHERAGSWRHFVFASLYLREGNSENVWRRDFDAFSPERRASLHWSYTDDSTLSGPSLFLAGVGVALLDLCCQAEEGQQHAQVLSVWRQVFEAVRPFVIHWSLSQDQWQTIATGLFARLPACATAGERQVAIPLAKEALTLLGGDDGLFVTALANLDSNGMSLAELAGTESDEKAMMDRIDDYLRWEASSGSRNLGERVVKYWENRLRPANTRARKGS